MQHGIKRFARVQEQRQMVAVGDVDLRGKGGALRGAVAAEEVEAAFTDGDGRVVVDLRFQCVQVVVAVFVLIERVQAVSGIYAGQGGARHVRPARAGGGSDDDTANARRLRFLHGGSGIGKPVEVAVAVGEGGHGVSG